MKRKLSPPALKKLNKFINDIREENPKKEVEPIAPNSEAESQTKYNI